MTSLATGLDAAIAGESIDNITFKLPWTARAFAIMLATSRAGHFTLKTFQERLITAIASAEAGGNAIETEEDYYTCWIEALTGLLESTQMISDQQLQSAEDKVRLRLIALQHDHTHDHSHDDHTDCSSHAHTRELPGPIKTELGKCK